MNESLIYAQVQEQHPAAWDALPDPYKNDRCLSFYVKNGTLYADYDFGGTFIFINGAWIGTW